MRTRKDTKEADSEFRSAPEDPREYPRTHNEAVRESP